MVASVLKQPLVSIKKAADPYETFKEAFKDFCHKEDTSTAAIVDFLRNNCKDLPVDVPHQDGVLMVEAKINVLRKLFGVNGHAILGAVREINPKLMEHFDHSADRLHPHPG